MKAAYREKINAPMDDVRCFVRFDSALDPIDTPPHWHTMTEILFVHEGVYTQQIGDRIFEIGPGDIVAIGEDQIHSTISTSRRKGSISVIQFYADKSASPTEISRKISSSDACSSDLSRLISSILTEYQSHSAASCCRVKAYLYQMQAVLLDHSPAVRCHFQGTENREFVVNVSGYIAENYQKELSLAVAAEHFHLSVPHFARLFKRDFGRPFMRYVNVFRLQLSNKLLEETKSVSETAYLCGFPNYATFCRQYKDYYNLTPKQYLKLKKNSLERNIPAGS